MDKSSLLKAFNNHLVELIDDILLLFPNDLNIKTARKFIIGLKKVNPKAVVKGWKNSINDEYREEVRTGNFDFFLKKDYHNDVGKDFVQSSSQILEAIDLIKKRCIIMSDENKKKTIKYIQNLVKLCDLYFIN